MRKRKHEPHTYRPPEQFERWMDEDEHGRDPRIPSGWWIGPYIIIGAAVWITVLVYYLLKYNALSP